MTWVWWALASALGIATADLVVKRYFADLPTTEVVVARFAGLLPASLILLALIEWPPLDSVFFMALGAALPAELVAMFLYVRAIQVSPLALTVPYLAFTPLFAIGTDYLVNGDLPSWAGLLGVVLLVAGAYGLNLHQARLGPAEPLRAIWQERGSWMMLAVSAIYAYTLVLGRLALHHSSPLFTAGFYPLLVIAAVAAVLLPLKRLTWTWLGRPWPAVALAGSMSAMAICHYLALAEAQASYMVAIKRMSPLFAVLYGGFLLKEARLLQHLAAALLMVGGALVIALAG